MTAEARHRLLAPLTLDSDDLRGWSDRQPLLFRFALAWARRAPRGKGRVPRELGRRLGRGSRFTIRTAGGAQLAVDPDNWETYTSIVLNGGVWDPHVTAACRRRLVPGNVFYDVGANAGLMSVEMGLAFADRVRVVAFEPQPTLALATARSAAINGLEHVAVHRLMLGTATGAGRLYVTSHSIHASSVAREDGASAIECPATTLDAFVAAGAAPVPDLVKIDVEGGEFDVLRGGERLLRESGPDLLFESDVNASRFGYGRKDLCEWLRAVGGYEFFLVTSDGIVPAGDRLYDESVPDLLASRASS